MFENLNLIPFIGPLVNLLRSRKFLVSVVTVIIDVLIAFLPEFEAVRVELLAVFTLIGSLLVASIAYEDGKKAGSGS